MRRAKSKALKAAAETKHFLIPYVDQMIPESSSQSYLYTQPPRIRPRYDPGSDVALRVAVVEGDPVDVALDWYDQNVLEAQSQNPGANVSVPRIPIVNMANEKRPGGDWESSLMAPEECLCRRSNLVRALTTHSTPESGLSHYPLPAFGGVYSPHVVIFGNGPEHYGMWKDFKVLPVISVSPVRRPKLDPSGTRYCFDLERELMMEKMRVILRIAAAWKHRDICLGAFGAGPIYRNPVEEIAKMWRTILFDEQEFRGAFSNVVFAIEKGQDSGNESGLSDLEVFKRVFEPSTVFQQ